MKLKPVQEQREVNMNLSKMQEFMQESAVNKATIDKLNYKVKVLEEQLDDFHIPASVSVRTFNNTISRIREQFEQELRDLIGFVNSEQSRVNQLYEDVYVDKRSSKLLENYSNKIQQVRLDFENEFRDLRKEIEERQRSIENKNFNMVETVDALRSDVETMQDTVHHVQKNGTKIFNEVADIRDKIEGKIRDLNKSLEENAIRLEDYQNKQQPKFVAIMEAVESLETAILHIEEHPQISKIKGMTKNILQLQKKVEGDIKEYNEYLLNKTVEIDQHIESKVNNIADALSQLHEADDIIDERLNRKVNSEVKNIRLEVEKINDSLVAENRELRKNTEKLTEDLKKTLAFMQSNATKVGKQGEVIKEEVVYESEGKTYIDSYAARLDYLIKNDYSKMNETLINEVNIQGDKPILYKDFSKYINKLQNTIALLGGGGSGSIFDIDYVQPGVDPSSLNDGDGLVWNAANQYFAFAPVGGGSTAGIGSTTALSVFGFFGTPQTITESINLPTGYNWFGVGPVNVSTGATINVEGTATLTIL